MDRTFPCLLGVALALVGVGAVAGCGSDSDEAAKPPSETSATPSTQSSEEPTGASSPGGYIPALIGTWDYEYDRRERRAILDNFAGLVDDADSVVGRLAFVDEDEWWQGFLFDGELFLLGGVPEGDGGTYAIHRDQLATTGAHGEALVTFSWSLKGRRLTLTAAEECEVVAGAKTGCTRDRSHMDPMMRLIMEHTFTRSGSDVTY